jgi:hypothetical protein
MEEKQLHEEYVGKVNEVELKFVKRMEELMKSIRGE